MEKYINPQVAEAESKYNIFVVPVVEYGQTVELVFVFHSSKSYHSKKKTTKKIKNVDIEFRMQNSVHQVYSKSVDWKAKLFKSMWVQESQRA